MCTYIIFKNPKCEKEKDVYFYPTCFSTSVLINHLSIVVSNNSRYVISVEYRGKDQQVPKACFTAKFCSERRK